jgi:hypothetical protein
MNGMNGIFDTVAAIGTQSAAASPVVTPVDMTPKPIGGSVVPPTVPAATPGETIQLAQGLLYLFQTSRAVTPEGAQALALAVAAVCGPNSALTPAQQGQAVNQILSSSTSVDKASVPVLYGIISMFIGQQPVGLRRAAKKTQGRKVIGESIFGNFLFNSDSLPQEAEHPWSAPAPTEPSADQPEPVTPAGTNGFGADDAAVDHAIPMGMKWLGHGVFGGKSRRGGYGMTQRGEPVTGLGRYRQRGLTGFGDVSTTYDPVQAPSTATTHFSVIPAGGKFAGTTYSVPTPLCGFFAGWPQEWPCNVTNSVTIATMLSTIQTARGEGTTAGLKPITYHLVDWVRDMRSGMVPSPTGFPSLRAAPPPPPPPPVQVGPTPQVNPTVSQPPPLQPPVQSLVQSPPFLPVMAPAVATSSKTGLFIGLGAAALALGTIGILLSTKKKKPAAAA